MTIQAEALKLKAQLIFTAQSELEKLFFDFPLSIDLLKTMGIALLLGFANEIKNKILEQYNETNLVFDMDNMNQLKNQIKKNPKTRAILKTADGLMDEEGLNNILLECAKIKQTKNLPSIFDSGNVAYLTEDKEDISKFIANVKVENSNSLQDKIDAIKEKFNAILDSITGGIEDVTDIMSDYLAYMLMAYYIVKLVISLFKRTDIPSGYLTKYVGKLINTLIASISDAVDELAAMFQPILDIITSVDAILTSLIVGMVLYLLNRKQYQKDSGETLKNLGCPDASSFEAFTENPIVIANKNDLDFNSVFSLNCPKKETLPAYLVPSEPFESKLANAELNCPLDFIEKEDIKELQESSPILATEAIIENQRTDKLNNKVKKGNKIKVGTLIGTIGEDNIYSPINGIISNISTNKIYIKDISDVSQSYLEQKAKSLSETYDKLNGAKDFLRKWAVPSLYPIMLANSPSSDGKITAKELLDIKYNGVNTIFTKLSDEYTVVLEKHDLVVQSITSKDNVKLHAENETLEKIKENLESEQTKLLNFIKKLKNTSINVAKQTKSIEGEYVLLDYYFELLLNLSGIENKTTFETDFYNNLHTFQEQRLNIEEFDSNRIKTRIYELYLTLANKSVYQIVDLNKKLTQYYNNTIKLNEIKDWLTKEGEENKIIEETEKPILINKILFLLEFSSQIPEYIEKYSNLDYSKLLEQIIKESTYINNYINDIFLTIENLPIQIQSMENELDDISLLTSYSIIEIDEVNYRKYVIPINSIDVKCTDPNLDVNVGGKTITDFSDIGYWIKYFSLATLTGLGMPGIGWATGFIGPSGPILFPVVYIPIKAIQMEYGFMVFGLTITGIVPMPFMMFANLSTNFQLPLFDPVVGLKNEINALKLNLVGELSQFKLVTIKQFLDKAEKELDSATSTYDSVKIQHNIHKTKKPPNTKKYIIERVTWNATNVELIQNKLTLGIAKFKAETKYSLLYILWNVGGGLSDKLSASLGSAFAALKQAETFLNAQFTSLSQMVESLEKIIGPLPITLQPDSANWLFTLKNPIPLTPFGINLTAPIIQIKILDPIIENFRAKNSGFMLPGGVKLDYTSYIELIQSMLAILIPREPFPAYEKLSLTNLGLMVFLTGELIPFGARQFGMPGMP